ncbi:MAG: hypothetical protein BWK80_26860 [Desulfobacteraceae bacterium IS3]|nr:MAG: hypothetical protein BWK80_26860 [Desulfobacteraceae bacterium IS3]
MNTDDIREQLEQELTWHADEIRFLENQLANLSKEDEKDKYRKALMVMLYSHFEGFFRFAFRLYKDAINKENLKCEEVTAYVTVSSLSDIFSALDNPQHHKKNDIFRRSLPEDTVLHRFCRRVDFMEALNDISKKTVNIPDQVVDTESNLKPIVIKKILFQLGFQHDKFDEYEHNIQQLLGVRNSIAHGSLKNGVQEKLYDNIKKDISSVMREIILMIIDELKKESFKK